MCLGFVLLAISAAVSTLLSVSPLLSWRGDYMSYQGLHWVLAYLVLFFATRHACRMDGFVVPLLAVVSAASALTSLYAIIQWAGHDPFAWTDVMILRGRFRPFSTVGHPNYLGVYLAMSLPLLAEAGRRASWLAAGSSPPHSSWWVSGQRQ